MAKDQEQTAAAGRTAMSLTHNNVPSARQSPVAHDNVFLPRQRLCRPLLARHTAKEALPEMTLPCGLCRASMHDNAIPVSIVPFAVPAWRTATKPFPVVFAAIVDLGFGGFPLSFFSFSGDRGLF
jgi:hypothetical protein